METPLPQLTGRRVQGTSIRRTGSKQIVCVATPTRPPTSSPAKRYAQLVTCT